MAYETPTTEPAELRAGDTLQWRKTLTDYPASDGWVLSYTVINAANKYSITSTADGDDHLINVPAATSAGYVAGQYRWVSSVTKAGDRFTVADGLFEILPDLAAEAGGLDIRSKAKKALDLIDAALLAYGSNAWTQEYQIAGRVMKFRSAEDFLRLRSQLQAEVAAEENADRIQQGLGSKNKVYTRL